MQYKKKLFELVDIKISSRKNKKYDAFIRNKKTGQIIKIPFGQKGYEHYQDITPIKVYSDYDHKDDGRKIKYQRRFRRMYNPEYWSPTSLSWTFLW